MMQDKMAFMLEISLLFFDDNLCVYYVVNPKSVVNCSTLSLGPSP